MTEHLEHLRFNSAVAQLYNWPTPSVPTGPQSRWPAVRREALEALVLLSAPMMPHLAETCWQALGHKRLAAETPWPKHDPALLKSDTVTIAVQVNGKLRATIQMAKAPTTRAWKRRRWRWKA